MTDDKLIDLWSDDDLDRALDALHTSEDPNRERLAETRARLMATAGVTTPQTSTDRPSRRRWRYALAAAASVAVLVAGGFLVTSSTQGGSAQAKAELDAAAAHITVADPVIPPGKYQHRTVRLWTETLFSGDGFEFRVLQEHFTETWMPADRAGEWVERSGYTGRHRWVTGSDEEARKHNVDVGPSSELARADCGNFTGTSACDRAGSWADPTPQWIAALPKDPEALYRKLKKDAPRNGRGETELLVYARDALQTGLLPADVRARLYQALGHLDDLEISDRTANLDGRTGIAYGSDDGEFREEIIVDPRTGAYIGARSVDTHGQEKGHVVSWTSVTTDLADTAPRR